MKREEFLRSADQTGAPKADRRTKKTEEAIVNNLKEVEASMGIVGKYKMRTDNFVASNYARVAD